nr:response regulator transcription factor [Microbacterium bovistercoris]
MALLKVALVNDYEVVVRGLATMLRSYQDVVEIVELDANASVLQPVDIALYDTYAGTPGNREHVRQLARNPQVHRVVVYSWNLDQQLVAETLANGADAYVSKELTAAELVKALLAVHQGRRPGATGARRSAAPVGGDWPGREEGLTQRESEVLALITQGMPNNDIADQMYLSVNSVKTHVRAVYRRIGVSDRANAVLWGIDHGFRPDRVRIIDPDIAPVPSRAPD